jgi:hypothetical protein
MSSWTSYPSIFAMGHRAISDLLKHEVNVEEKVDGSQFSFGLVEASDVDVFYPYQGDYRGFSNLALKIRSKGCVMHIDAPEKMFNHAAATVRELADQLIPGWTYRGEFLARPKHNALAYDRVPKGNIILFDVNSGDQEYLSYEDKANEASRLGLEVVPLLYSGRVDSVEQFRRFLSTVSVLGGQAIEGVVVKPTNYDLYGQDKKVLMGKFVSEAFKEIHRKSWGESNPTTKDIISRIVDSYATPARWNKAIQHLREAGKLVEDVRDIGPIIKEIPSDVLKECEDDIKDELFKFAWPHIRRGLSRGFPEYYKDQLLKRSFEDETGTASSGDPAVLVDSNVAHAE